MSESREYLGPPQRVRAFVAVLAASALFGASSVLAGVTDSASTVSSPARTKTLGFAVISLPLALAKNADDCPEGMALAAKEIYLAAVSPAERERLTKGENVKEFEQKAYHTTDGKDLCQAPDYPRAPQRTPQGKVSYGMNLDGTADGAATDTTCAHEKFTAPDGVSGIDNQAYRVLGCSSNFRGFPGEEGYMESLRNSAFKDGGTTILIEISGVSDPKNSDDVTVGVYTGTSPMMVDANGHMLPYASLTVTDDKTLQSKLHGRIENGVLTTQSGDITLQYALGGTLTKFHLTSARLRLTLGADGTAKGMLAAYMRGMDIDFSAVSKQALSEMIGEDCPSFTQAVHRYADGVKDPKTGQCTALSTAFNIDAIPAFVIHTEDAKKTAQALSATTTAAH